jgi:hypothetical protein
MIGSEHIQASLEEKIKKLAFTPIQMNSIQETECADKVVKYLASSMWENSA